MECCRYGADPGLHEDDVGRFNGCIGTAAHSSADIGTGQDGCIVDAVADKENRPVLLAQGIHLIDFILRQQFGPDVVDARLRGDVICGFLRITGEHGRRYAHARNSLDGVDSVFFDGIRNDQAAGIGPVNGDVQLRAVFDVVHGRQDDVAVIHELAVAAEDRMAAISDGSVRLRPCSQAWATTLRAMG